MIMDLYKKLQRNPKQFLAFTGMPLHTFQDLLPQFQQAFDDLQQRRKRHTVRSQSNRQRQPGGGKAFHNGLENRLLMVLVYYRLYLTQEFMTLLFNAADKSLISRNIQLMRQVLEALLPTPERARQRLLSLAKGEGERRNKRIGTIEEFRDAYPELTFIIDGVEQPKQKPKDQQKRKADYSGKKKRHTRKQLLTTTVSGIIVDQSPSVGGRTHDFQAFKEDCAKRSVCREFAAVWATFYADSGFQGMQKVGLPVEVRLQERGRRNHPLTPSQQQLNAIRSRVRVKVEHTISRRKKYRIAAEVYRNRDEDYDQVMTIVGGLVNLRAYERIFQRAGVRL